jgi:type IV secretory pathway VirB2 component (pilin)
MDHVTHRVASVLLVLLMVVIIVGADVLFFRNHFWARLLVNIGIVLVFGGIYLRFLRP